MESTVYKIKLTLPEIEGDLVKWSAYEDETFIAQGEDGMPYWAFDAAVTRIKMNLES